MVSPGLSMSGATAHLFPTEHLISGSAHLFWLTSLFGRTSFLVEHLFLEHLYSTIGGRTKNLKVDGAVLLAFGIQSANIIEIKYDKVFKFHVFGVYITII